VAPKPAAQKSDEGDEDEDLFEMDEVGDGCRLQKLAFEAHFLWKIIK
jgi:hypothetical protein